MNAGIDYVLRLAADPNGTDCGNIDTTKLAATGYSMGGGGAIGVAANARITATFLFAALGTNNAKNIKAPWAGTFAENDEFFAWSTVKPNILASTQPAFGEMITGTTHNTLPGNAKSGEAYIAFLRLRSMGDAAGKQLFVGPSCQICTDTAFGEVVKTPTWDSL
jgi:dienelactone hydrolase